MSAIFYFNRAELSTRSADEINEGLHRLDFKEDNIVVPLVTKFSPKVNMFGTLLIDTLEWAKNVGVETNYLPGEQYDDNLKDRVGTQREILKEEGQEDKVVLWIPYVDVCVNGEWDRIYFRNQETAENFHKGLTESIEDYWENKWKLK